MMYKTRPHTAIRTVPQFLVQEEERRTKRSEVRTDETPTIESVDGALVAESDVKGAHDEGEDAGVTSANSLGGDNPSGEL